MSTFTLSSQALANASSIETVLANLYAAGEILLEFDHLGELDTYACLVAFAAITRSNRKVTIRLPGAATRTHTIRAIEASVLRGLLWKQTEEVAPKTIATEELRAFTQIVQPGSAVIPTYNLREPTPQRFGDLLTTLLASARIPYFQDVRPVVTELMFEAVSNAEEHGSVVLDLKQA